MVSRFSDPGDASEVVTFRRLDASEEESNSGMEVLQDAGLAGPSAAGQDEGEDNEKSDEEEDEDVYVVEKIVAHRKGKKGKSFEYKVRWEGYEEGDDTWEPHDNIAESASAALDTYWEPLGGYENNRNDVLRSAGKRKRQSASADLLPSNTVATKRRRVTEDISAASKEIEDAPAGGEENVPQAEEAAIEKSAWRPPLELVSWEGEAVVDTIEKDENNELHIFLDWPKDKERSRHKADLVYKKMPQSMLQFYEANLVFKAAK